LRDGTWAKKKAIYTRKMALKIWEVKSWLNDFDPILILSLSYVNSFKY
jgi:hypothetical protein